MTLFWFRHPGKSATVTHGAIARLGFCFKTSKSKYIPPSRRCCQLCCSAQSRVIAKSPPHPHAQPLHSPPPRRAQHTQPSLDPVLSNQPGFLKPATRSVEASLDLCDRTESRNDDLCVYGSRWETSKNSSEDEPLLNPLITLDHRVTLPRTSRFLDPCHPSAHSQ